MKTNIRIGILTRSSDSTLAHFAPPATLKAAKLLTGINTSRLSNWGSLFKENF